MREFGVSGERWCDIELTGCEIRGEDLLLGERWLL